MIPRYRAFIKATEQMKDVTVIDFDIKDVQVSTGMWHEFEEIILMQSTGLFDKNGVEIFEGDLVEHDDEGVAMKACEVVYEQRCGTYCFKWDAGNFLTDYDNLVVIGNIHENKKLLEV